MSLDGLVPEPATRSSLLPSLPKAFLAGTCLAVLFWAFFNDAATATPGLEWVPRVRLRMEFNSLPFMLLFVPCTFALYAITRSTRAANFRIAPAQRTARENGTREGPICGWSELCGQSTPFHRVNFPLQSAYVD